MDTLTLLTSICDLKFPQDTQELVKILNKLQFRGLNNWFAYTDSYEVFSPSEKNTHYTDSFMQQLLRNYLETKENLERIESKLNLKSKIKFWVDEDYFFRIETRNELFEEYISKPLIPSQCAREFAIICMNLNSSNKK